MAEPKMIVKVTAHSFIEPIVCVAIGFLIGHIVTMISLFIPLGG